MKKVRKENEWQREEVRNYLREDVVNLMEYLNFCLLLDFFISEETDECMKIIQLEKLECY